MQFTNKNKNFRINLEGHRRRVRKYAQHGLGKLVKIGKGENSLLNFAPTKDRKFIF
jgi:hypothetical protein